MQALAARLANAPRRPRPDRPVPVTLAITDLDVGGAERALVALATGLDRDRWKVSVVALSGEGALAGLLRSARIDTVCLDVDRRRPGRAVARLARAIRGRPPELIQSFLFHANIAVRFAARMAGRPWVVGGIRVAERGANWHRTLDRATIRLTTGSVCVSKGVERFSREVARLPADRLITIPNGVDPRPFDVARPVDRSTLAIPPESPLALFVGRLDRQKGVPILLDAAERVAADRPDWRLILAGDGPEGEALRRRTAAHPALADRVRWLGRRDDVPGLLKAADVLVLPSLWEGMPNVILEAMAARRAVVATAIEGSEDLVLPGETGWLVPPGDPRSLADALLDAASDPALSRAFGEAGRARVEADWGAAVAVAAYDRLWSMLLGYFDNDILKS